MKRRLQPLIQEQQEKNEKKQEMIIELYNILTTFSIEDYKKIILIRIDSVNINEIVEKITKQIRKVKVMEIIESFGVLFVFDLEFYARKYIQQQSFSIDSEEYQVYCITPQNHIVNYYPYEINSIQTKTIDTILQLYEWINQFIEWIIGIILFILTILKEKQQYLKG